MAADAERCCQEERKQSLATELGMPEMNGKVDSLEVDIDVFESPVLSYENLSYSVDVPTCRVSCCCCCCCTAKKQILHQLSGIFYPGMNALMGSAGSGKTTLLNVLAGRTDKKGVSGTKLVHGYQPPPDFIRITGYVEQKDVATGTLTVRENLTFSANLRLPRSTSNSERQQKVDDVINELGLTACSDVVIGTKFIRGVSDGDRKRVNIGMEIIINPSILFLDEPTTGLDGPTAYAIMSLLHSLSRKNRTVIFSIYQPRYAIFKLCDRLSLLADGHNVFHGPASEALTFFRSLGYQYEAYNNPPDFFMDVVSDEVPLAINNGADELKPDAAQSYVVDNDVNASEIERVHIEDEKGQSLAEKLAEKFSHSDWSHSVEEILKSISTISTAADDANKAVAKGRNTASFIIQLWYVSLRTVRNIVRNPQAALAQVVTFTNTYRLL